MKFVFDVRPEDGPARRWSTSAERIYIGRASSCDLVLTSGLVSAQHATIDATGSTPFLSDLNSTNGTYLNGIRLDAPSPVRVGDVIGFGQGGTTLLAVVIEPDSKVIPRKTEALAIPSTMPVRRDTISPPNRVVWIGRLPNNDVVLDDPSVSSRHARIVVDRPGHGILEDQGSTNGVAVGHVTNRVQRAEITAGDLIFFGTVAVAAEKLVGHGGHSAQPPPAVAPASTGNPLRNVAIGIAACVVLAALAGSVLLTQRTASSEPKVAESAAPVSHPPNPSPVQPPPPAPTDQPKTRVTPEKAAPDFHLIAERARSALVWLGVKHKNYLFPYASAWAVKPTVLVSTAAVVTELEKMARKPDMEIFAWSNGAQIPARSFNIHPQYSPADPTSEESIRHNIGVVRVVIPVSSTLRAASQDTVRSLGPTTSLMASGFFSMLGQYDPYDRLKLRFEHSMLALRSTENDRSGAAPVFVVDVPHPDGQSSGHWFDGAPVQAGDETVVGLLSTGSAGIRMIPIDASLWKDDP